MAKHKIKLKAEADVEKFIHKHVFGSVRNKVLQKLLLLAFQLKRSETELYKGAAKRLVEKKLLLNLASIAYELEPEDIMGIIGCSERTAIEYIDALRYLFG
mgnify:CR=1 FL=1